MNKKRFIFLSVSFSVVLVMFFLACKNQEKNPEKMDETILQGSTTILVDESVQPITEDEVAVFESQYNAKIKLINKPESEVINDLINDKAKIAILSRKLNSEEEKIFINKKLSPKITEFAVDAITLIASKNAKDTLIDLQEVLNLLQRKASKIKGLVFENPNSSTVNYMNNIAGVGREAKKNVFSLKSNEEVLKYVAENDGMIGVVGLNLIVQPSTKIQNYLDKVQVLAVRNVKSKPDSNNYYKPSQSNIGAGLYPLERKLYMLNYQGKEGLGMGFASFIAGETGQRIILKSGLLPVRIPSRIIQLRKEIEKK
ncbi:MAG: substrate-binding domain-containing protein [Flavobacterium sp.]|nr:substrate-binding domain-containing protein [Flavobacterium sp.]